MNKLIVLLILLSSCYEQHLHTGKMIDKGKEEAYYQINNNARGTDYSEYNAPTYFVIIADDSTKRNLRFNVDIDTYYRYKVGNKLSFKVDDCILSEYGN